MRVGLLNGPNLNRLGEREPRFYGHLTLAQIEERLREAAAERGDELVAFQSNHEGELVDWLEREAPRLDGLLLNAGALTHSSVVLRDALASWGGPFVEIHLSNVFAREPFRHRSMVADLAVGVVAGFRGDSYLLALRGLCEHLSRRT